MLLPVYCNVHISRNLTLYFLIYFDIHNYQTLILIMYINMKSLKINKEMKLKIKKCLDQFYNIKNNTGDLEFFF